MPTLHSVYVDGYAKALAIDSEAANNYIRHTTIGDPLMDAAVKDLTSVSRSQASRFIAAGMDQDEEILRDAPQSLRTVFAEPEPPWVDHEAFAPGIRASKSISSTSSPRSWLAH